MEGSKELDFQAEMEADTAGDAAGAEESEDGRGNSSSSSSSSSGGLKMSASSSSLGGKRSFGNTGALVKEEEIGGENVFLYCEPTFFVYIC